MGESNTPCPAFWRACSITLRASSMRLSAAFLSAGREPNERRLALKELISVSIAATASAALVTSYRGIAFRASSRCSEVNSLRAFSRSRVDLRTAASICASSAGRPLTSSASLSACACFNFASAVEMAPCISAESWVATVAPACTVLPRSTSSRSNFPGRSARTETHSKGSTLPLVASISTNVSILTSA